ncbi:hypothetical protein ACOSP7_020231 [Xanthoceras sorbifolium]
MEVFSEKIINLWNVCEIRVMILLSLFLQIVLITFGSRRKFTAGSWISITVWSAYLMADWVATVALGNLANSQGYSDANRSTDKKNSHLHEFWAPFLLLHLGGPDTITAYSLEDNELWLRHLLGLVVQVGVAFYIIIRSWSNNNALTFIAIPVFISGIIKYGERNFVLRSLSNKHFENSIVSTPDPFQDFVEDVDEDLRVKRMTGSTEDGINQEDLHLVQAYLLFKRVEIFFAGLVLNTIERRRIYSIIKYMSAVEAFKVIEIELGFMFDVLYTKATIVYTRLGIFLRFLSFACSLSALVVFFVIINIHDHSQVDISITYSLLVGAFLLEIYAFIILFFSNWTNLWFIKLKKSHDNTILKAFVDRWFSGHCHSVCIGPRRQSGSIRQYNLITTSWRKRMQPAYIRWVVQKLPYMDELLEECLHWTRTDVNIKYLQEKIFRSLQEKADKINQDWPRDKMLAQRGAFVLEKYRIEIDFSWCTTRMKFIDSLVIWHLATDFIYHADQDHADLDRNPDKFISKCLSDYMMYLLVFCPSMLPKDFGETKRYEATSAKVIQIFEKMRNDITNASKVREVLIQHYTQSHQERVAANVGRGMRQHEPLLKYGCILYRQLQSDEIKEGKWKIISEVWVEMLGYAAHKCGWKLHCQHLRKGGRELLTHVCLLMAHFGLTEQYEID